MSPRRPCETRTGCRGGFSRPACAHGDCPAAHAKFLEFFLTLMFALSTILWKSSMVTLAVAGCCLREREGIMPCTTSSATSARSASACPTLSGPPMFHLANCPSVRGNRLGPARDPVGIRPGSVRDPRGIRLGSGWDLLFPPRQLSNSRKIRHFRKIRPRQNHHLSSSIAQQRNTPRLQPFPGCTHGTGLSEARLPRLPKPPVAGPPPAP